MNKKLPASELARRIRANARRYRLRNKQRIKEYMKKYYLEKTKQKRKKLRELKKFKNILDK